MRPKHREFLVLLPPVENEKRITSADGGMGVTGNVRNPNSNTDTVPGPVNSLYPFQYLSIYGDQFHWQEVFSVSHDSGTST